MVESVDTRDLKSLDHYGRAGSTPAPGTNSDIRLSLFLEGAGANVLFFKLRSGETYKFRSGETYF